MFDVLKTYAYLFFIIFTTYCMASIVYVHSTEAREHTDINKSAFEVARDSALKEAAKFGIPSASSRAYVYKIVGMLWHEDASDIACNLLKETFIAEERGEFTSAGLYWSMPALVRIYYLFNSQTGKKSNLLNRETEKKLLNVFWSFINREGDGAYTTVYEPWRLTGSENHDMLRRSTTLLIAQVLKDQPSYKNKKFSWGQSPYEFYEDAIEFFNIYLIEKVKRGVFIEGSGIYHGVTLEGIYNILDFANDLDLQVRAEMLLDVYWIDHAIESVNGIRGGAKARIYPFWRDTVETTPFMLGIFYFTPDIANNIAIRPMPPGFVPILTSNYRPPEIARRLVTDPDYRGEFEYLTRRPGVSEYTHAKEIVAGSYMVVYYVEAERSVLCYSYVTPYYIMGSFIHNPEDTLSLISSQNRWEGVIFAADTNDFLYPYLDTEHNVHNAFSTTQKGSVMITQLRPHIIGDVKINFPYRLKQYEFQPEGGWFIGDIAGDTFFGIKAVNSSLLFDSGRLVLMDCHSPVIIRAGNIDNYASFDEFMDKFFSDLIDYHNGILTYRTSYGEVKTDFVQRFLDGEEWNYEPDYVFNSPFIRLKWGSAEVVLLCEAQEIIYDFDKAKRTSEIKRIK